jgi:preprotein translocase SecE subunit
MAVVEKLRETQTFIEESWGELQKVTWPDREQLQSATLVVILFVFVISAVIWFMDVTVRWLVEQIMTLFGA